MKCVTRVMLSSKYFSQMRLDRAWGFAQRFGSWGSLMAVLIAIQQLSAGGDLLIRQQTSPQSVAFGRYIASLEHRSPFAESGPIAVMIEASIPALYKESV